MFKRALLATSLLTTLAMASDPYRYITVDSDAVSLIESTLQGRNLTSPSFSNEGVSVIKIKESKLLELSHLMHEEFHRCGGFILHDDLETAAKESAISFSMLSQIPFVNYTIDREEIVEKLVSEVDEFKIREVITKLSSYHNRFYKSETGVASQKWVKAHWESLAKNRSDVTVEEFNHSKWPQPSIILTIKGTSKADEIVIFGGHGDSISGMFMQAQNKAPGADDNASGIATLTETIRVAMENNYKPERTIKFISYAAEEVGLLGSKEIARNFKANGKNVVGVMQLDMTNHKGSRNLDIVFMNDYTNASQNEFMGKLIDRYVKVPWGYSKCGYGCSDHASWHTEGYPASMPFESTMEEINRKIHTSNDTLDNSNGNAFHALNFSKLASAFLVEMGK